MPSIVRKCCSARVSVGAIRAPCRPLDRAQERVERDHCLARRRRRPAAAATSASCGQGRRRSRRSPAPDAPSARREARPVAGDEVARAASAAATVASRRPSDVQAPSWRTRARRRRAAAALPRPPRARAAGGARRARRRASGRPRSPSGQPGADPGVVGERQRRLDEVAELRRRDLLARGVDRREVGRRRAPRSGRTNGPATRSGSEPRSRTRVPGVSLSLSHGWLNHVADSPVPSVICAVSVGRPRPRRIDVLTTWPSISTSSSPKSSEIIRCGAGRS